MAHMMSSATFSRPGGNFTHFFCEHHLIYVVNLEDFSWNYSLEPRVILKLLLLAAQISMNLKYEKYISVFS